MKAKKMPTLLEGEALAIWLDLSTGEQANYKEAKERITAPLAPMSFVSLDDFHARCLRPDKLLSVYIFNVLDTLVDHAKLLLHDPQSQGTGGHSEVYSYAQFGSRHSSTGSGNPHRTDGHLYLKETVQQSFT